MKQVFPFVRAEPEHDTAEPKYDTAVYFEIVIHAAILEKLIRKSTYMYEFEYVLRPSSHSRVRFVNASDLDKYDCIDVSTGTKCAPSEVAAHEGEEKVAEIIDGIHPALWHVAPGAQRVLCKAKILVVFCSDQVPDETLDDAWRDWGL